jgi:hypothetical protein
MKWQFCLPLSAEKYDDPPGSFHEHSFGEPCQASFKIFHYASSQLLRNVQGWYQFPFRTDAYTVFHINSSYFPVIVNWWKFSAVQS